VLVFPPFDQTWLVWVALVPVLLLVPAPRARAAAAAAWLSGTLMTLGLVGPWLWPTARDAFGGAPATTLAFVLAVSQTGCGLPFLALGILLQGLSRLGPAARTLATAAAWVGIEWVRAHLPGVGIPWALVGTALVDRPFLVQVADLGGVYAVSLLVAVANAAVVEVLRARRLGTRAAARAIAVALALLGAATLYGTLRHAEIRARMAAAPTTRVALVHADRPPARDDAVVRVGDTVERFLALGAPAADALDLVVWPENAVTVLLEENRELLDRIAARAAVPHLVGAPRAVPGPRGVVFRTSALLVDRGGIRARYDKRRLVPFAETGPVFGASQLFRARYYRGTGDPVLAAAPARLGPLLCYEAAFPELARAAVRAGADLLVNMSNDAWFPPGGGPEQHFLFTRLRAVELRRSLLRAANRGVTAVVLPDGRLLRRTDGRTPGTEVASVPRLDTVTVYARGGDLLAWLCLAGAGAATLIAGRRRHHGA
jgi:apolipoprotein N-acyltransferase